MKRIWCLLIGVGLMASPQVLASSTTYQFEATIRVINPFENPQVTSDEIINYLNTIGITLGQTITGSVGLTPLGPDDTPDNNLYQHFDAIDSGGFTIGTNTFGYTGLSKLTAINGEFDDLDQIGIFTGLSTDLPLTSIVSVFAFTDYTNTAISGSDLPEYPIDLDSYSPFMVNTTAIMNTGMEFSFRIPGNALVTMQAEFNYFTPVPLPGGSALLMGALVSLLTLRKKN